MSVVSCDIVYRFIIFSASKHVPILAFSRNLFRGGGCKIYCYANFFCYANFSIVFGPNFRGDKKSPRGDASRRDASLPPVEESQYLEFEFWVPNNNK